MLIFWIFNIKKYGIVLCHIYLCVLFYSCNWYANIFRRKIILSTSVNRKESGKYSFSSRNFPLCIIDSWLLLNMKNHTNQFSNIQIWIYIKIFSFNFSYKWHINFFFLHEPSSYIFRKRVSQKTNLTSLKNENFIIINMMRGLPDNGVEGWIH